MEVEDSLTNEIAKEENAFNPLDGGGLLDEVETAEETTEEATEAAVEEPEEVVEEEPAEAVEEEPAEEATEDEEADDEEADDEEEPLSTSLKSAAKPSTRDYSKYDKEDAKYLRQMSNEAFEHFSKRAEELQELEKKTAAAAHTADHPDAYVLSDEYRDAYANLSKAQQEQQHWREQLIHIRKGDEWRTIQGYDKEGRMVLGQSANKPTQQAEIDVEMALQEAVTLNRKFSDAAQNVSKSFKGNYSDAVQLLEHEQNANFAWLTNDKVAKEEIVLPSVGKTTINDVKQSFSNALPKPFRKHPLAELASNLFVTLQLQAAATGAEKVKAKEARRKEPKAKRKSAAAAAPDDFSVPDWMDL